MSHVAWGAQCPQGVRDVPAGHDRLGKPSAGLAGASTNARVLPSADQAGSSVTSDFGARAGTQWRDGPLRRGDHRLVAQAGAVAAFLVFARAGPAEIERSLLVLATSPPPEQSSAASMNVPRLIDL